MKAGSKTVSKEATLEPRNVGAMEPTSKKLGTNIITGTTGLITNT